MRHFKIKNIFSYVVVAALVMALSISCKSNEEPPKDNTHSNHPPSGTYKGTVGSITTTATVTTSGGACNIKGIAYNTSNRNQRLDYDITITKWYSGDGSTDKGSYSRIDGNNYQGEATVTEPTTATSFYVDYSSGRISIQFFDQNEAYNAGPMTKE